MRSETLPTIIAYARAGALDYAWTQFQAAGFDQQTRNPAALCVRGRLLKDRALLASGQDALDFFRAAAEAYLAADEIDPQPYPLINVATLSYLAGDRQRAAGLAREVLARLDGSSDIAETPYYIAATRAEASILLGDIAAADRSMAAAIAEQPDGWSDHASTIRQLGLILKSGGVPAGWLDRHRPPRSIHFAGHLGVSASDSASLRAQIDRVLTDERVGFGYGALAAGSDIMIAESLLERGGKLHVILPTTRDCFRAQSVSPYGKDWEARFAACLSAAESVREMTAIEGPYEPLATALSSEVAMGAAALNARQLESEAIQLLITDEGLGPFGTGAGTAYDGATWEAAGRRQSMIRWPRNAPVVASGNKGVAEAAPNRKLAAMLYSDIANFEALDEQQIPVFLHHVLKPLAAAVEAAPVSPLHVKSWGQGFIIAFETVDAAATCALAMRTIFNSIDLAALGLPKNLALKVAGHYGLVHTAFDPFAGQGGLFGCSVTLAARIEPVTAPGAIYVTEDFVSALFARGRFVGRTEYVGDHEPLKAQEQYRLFALKER